MQCTSIGLEELALPGLVTVFSGIVYLLFDSIAVGAAR
jgi:hypothetical protein